MDYSLHRTYVHGIFQARILERWHHFLLQGIFLTQGLDPGPALQTDYLLLVHQGSPRGEGKRWGKCGKFQDLDQWSRPELNLVHSRHLALAGWMSDYHMTSFTSLMLCDGIQLLSTLVYILDKWNPFLNDEMITQNVLSLPLSLSRIKKPVPVSLHGFDIYIHACVLSHFSHECLLQRYGLLPTRLLCPWDSPGKNTGVGCHVLLQGIFQPRDHTLISCSSCTAGSFFTAGKEESPCVVSVCYTDILYCFIFLCTWISYWRHYP